LAGAAGALLLGVSEVDFDSVASLDFSSPLAAERLALPFPLDLRLSVT